MTSESKANIEAVEEAREVYRRIAEEMKTGYRAGGGPNWKRVGDAAVQVAAALSQFITASKVWEAGGRR